MRIVIADDRDRVRFALRTLLDQHPKMTIVGETSRTPDLLLLLETACPDAILLDGELPGLVAGETLAALRHRCPHLCIIVLSGRTENRAEVLAAGADWFVSKIDPPEHLLAALDACQGNPQFLGEQTHRIGHRA